MNRTSLIKSSQDSSRAGGRAGNQRWYPTRATGSAEDRLAMAGGWIVPASPGKNTHRLLLNLLRLVHVLCTVVRLDFTVPQAT
jgi:hypothetical protein